ncbi:MAG: hypothetical protein NUV55_00040 [Sulfuricaulis sp.]|uniref:hypothetical protein n=1 Tax=Sulfuricaulis sp. TaxID=2003553 RepID=UPI0025E69E53|nr:hypothetical protein [Sulfuricaulis sp.]MCR4345587.1 hypothetical protein [Sulfuricaulis sp.]
MISKIYLMAAITTALASMPGAVLAAVTHDFNPPGVKTVSFSSGNFGKADAGKPVSVKCTIGFVGTKKINHDGKGADAYLHANSWQLPFEMRVGGKVVLSEKIPAITPTATWNKEYQWTPSATQAGKPVWAECVIDPQNKVYASAQKAYVTVAGAPAGPLTRTSTIAQTHKAGSVQMARPDLLVENAGVSLVNSCQTKQSARVRVRVKNAGGSPFPASPGNYVLFVDAGPGLMDAGVELPALSSNQSVEKELVLNALGEPSQLAGKTIPLEIQLNKLKWVAEANHLNNTRKLSVSFPANYCKTATRALPGHLKLPGPPR